MKIYADEPWARYVLKIFFQTYNISDNEDFTISYGKNKEKGIEIRKGNVCSKNIVFKGENIPIFYCSNKITEDYLTNLFYYNDGSIAVTQDEDKNKIVVYADILKTCFNLLSRQEEINTPHDRLNRFQSKYCINQNLQKPLVNQYFQFLYYLSKNYLKENNDQSNLN